MIFLSYLYPTQSILFRAVIGQTHTESITVYYFRWKGVEHRRCWTVPGLQLQRSFLARNLKRVRVILIEGLHHLHAVDANACAHRKLLPYETEFGNAVQQHVVELWEILQTRWFLRSSSNTTLKRKTLKSQTVSDNKQSLHTALCLVHLIFYNQ